MNKYIPKALQFAARRARRRAAECTNMYMSSETSAQQRCRLKGEGYIIALVFVLNVTFALALSGCGQKGPLFLPADETKQTNED